VSLRRLHDEGKALRKGLVLKPDDSCFSRVGGFVFGQGTTMGRWKSSYCCIELCAELGSHSFTSCLSKDRFHGRYIRINANTIYLQQQRRHISTAQRQRSSGEAKYPVWLGLPLTSPPTTATTGTVRSDFQMGLSRDSPTKSLRAPCT
jgi:hypothetical protein